MATILYLRLDAANDPVFDPNVALEDLQAVDQAIKTGLLLFEGEWFEDANVGLPLFQQILGVVKRSGNQDLATLAIIAQISKTPFVSGVINAQSQVSPNRNLNFSATAQTVFGTTPVNFTPPAFTASLGI